MPNVTKGLPSRVLEAVRSAPNLTLIAALGGLTVLIVIVFQLARFYLSGEAGWEQVELIRGSGNDADFVADFLLLLFKAGSWVLAPAFVLALIRGRGLGVVLPVALASLFIWGWWLTSELQTNFRAAFSSNLGETPSIDAYYGKLVIISLMLLSPGLVTWLYQRASILDRHVVRSFLTPFFLCFLGLMTLIIIMDLLNNGRDFVDAKFSFLDVLKFYGIQVPKILIEIIDISLLLALLHSLSRMSRYNEIISMVSCGRSLFRILLPLILLGMHLTLVAMACNYQWAPQAERRKEDMLKLAEGQEKGRDRRGNKDLSGAKNVLFPSRTQQRLWFCKYIPLDHDKDHPIQGVRVYQKDKYFNTISSIYADKVWWSPRTRTWKFRPAYTIDYTQGDDPVMTATPEMVKEWSETPWQVLSASDKIRPEYLGVQELSSYLKTNSSKPEVELAPYRTHWQDRFGLPFRCLLVVLYGAPLGIVFSRRGILGGVAGAVFIFVAMRFLNILSLKFGEGFQIPALVAGWGTNAILAVVGGLLLWLRSTNRSLGDLWTGFWRRKSKA